MRSNFPSWLIVCFAGLLTLPLTAWAAPPSNPLPPPFYSFDLASPAVTGGFVEADDVLALNLPYPLPAIPAAALGLGATGDDLDGLCGGHPLFSTQTQFALRFSVTRESTGNVPPEPGLVALFVPYNVMDQAGRGHQAGDEYLSLRRFTLSGPLARSRASSDNHTMVENNYDEGGSDFAARPETHAGSMTPGVPQDNVDALADLDLSGSIYYSATSSSPSLGSLPGSGNPSGASVFLMRLGLISSYASYSQLGLQQGDDVDACVVFDLNADGVFNDSDRVLFSLTPNSPSLTAILGTSVNGAADVFVAAPGQAPALFTTALSLGLIADQDDIDALEILVCADPFGCAAEHGIRRIPGDFNDDGNVDALDLDSFNDCYSGDGQSYPPGCEPGDFDADGDIDCQDGTAFVLGWTAPGPAGVPSQCRASIPTVSQWGAVALALVLTIAGSCLIRARRAIH